MARNKLSSPSKEVHGKTSNLIVIYDSNYRIGLSWRASHINQNTYTYLVSECPSVFSKLSSPSVSGTVQLIKWCSGSGFIRVKMFRRQKLKKIPPKFELVLEFVFFLMQTSIPGKCNHCVRLLRRALTSVTRC